MYRNRSNRNRQIPLPPAIGLGIYCLNCGKTNHMQNMCSEPFSSYGLLCFYKKAPECDPKIVMVCRKHTIPYIDFLRGKYDVNKLGYILELFTKMTADEINKITLLADFEKLRTDLGLNNRTQKAYKLEYETSELKFNYLLKLGILHKIITCINHIYKTEYNLNVDADSSKCVQDTTTIIKEMSAPIASLEDLQPKLYATPEWGIPKGKRQLRETDLQCSIREFSEETGIPGNCIRVYKNMVPLEEIYTGMNGQQYKHIYFMAEIIINPVSTEKLLEKMEQPGGHIITPEDEQFDEISRVKLMTQADAIASIRPFHTNKKSVIQKAFYIISQFRTFFYYF